MPLRCINPEGQNIHSFDLSADAWHALLQENKKATHLKMTCCNAAVVLKRSQLGTQFFAHKAKGMCATAPEREEHLILKQEAVLAARRNGWQANTEVSGRTPDGEEWRADVLAEKGKHKVAVEIQWSGQSNEETVTRQERYKKSGIRCLWLMRQTKFPISRDLPAVCLDGNLEKGFMALIPKRREMKTSKRNLPELWHKKIGIKHFLDAVFGRRFCHTLDLKGDIEISVRARTVKCLNCRAANLQITPIRFAAFDENGFVENERYIHFIDLPSNISKLIEKGIIESLKAGQIKISGGKNVCVNCDELIDSKLSILKDYMPPQYSEELNYQKITILKTPSSPEVIEFLGPDWIGHWTVIPKAK